MAARARDIKLMYGILLTMSNVILESDLKTELAWQTALRWLDACQKKIEPKQSNHACLPDHSHNMSIKIQD